MMTRQDCLAVSRKCTRWSLISVSSEATSDTEIVIT